MNTAHHQQTVQPVIRDFYLRPEHPHLLPGEMAASDVDDEDAVLVLETDLPIEPGKPCEDQRLEDILIALEPMVRYAQDSNHHITSVEIRGKMAKELQAAMDELSKLPS